MNRLPLILAMLLAGTSASIFSQENKSSFGDLAVVAPKLAALQNQFEQPPPKGVSIEAREVSRTGVAGKDLRVAYNIYLKGVLADAMLRQLQWPVDRGKPISGFVGITLNSDGLMMCAGRTPEQCHSSAELDAPITFVMEKPLKGEPRRSIFIFHDLRIPLSIVPEPIESEDRGCKLRALRLSAKFEVALIEAAGFRPNSQVHVHMTDDGSDRLVATAHDDGQISSVHANANDVLVSTDGRGIFQITSVHNPDKSRARKQTVEINEPSCAPKVSYEWGVF